VTGPRLRGLAGSAAVVRHSRLVACLGRARRYIDEQRPRLGIRKDQGRLVHAMAWALAVIATPTTPCGLASGGRSQIRLSSPRSHASSSAIQRTRSACYHCASGAKPARPPTLRGPFKISRTSMLQCTLSVPRWATCRLTQCSEHRHQREPSRPFNCHYDRVR
jgi:hypothetical protein